MDSRRPSSSRSGRRPLPLVVAAVVVLGALLWWLGGPGMTPVDLGPAVRLVARPGAEAFLVDDGVDGWHLFREGARTPEEGLPVPGPVEGEPLLDGRGRALVLSGGALRRLEPDGTGRALREERIPLGDPAPAGCRLVGVDGADEPVLLVPAAAPAGTGATSGDGVLDGREPPTLRVRRGDGRFVVLALEGTGPASPRADSPIVVSQGRRALAFLGLAGWEAWIFDDPAAPLRRQAPRCLGAQAVFTPDNRALVLDGPVDGLWRLELDDDRQGYMADGNLGHAARVPWSSGFRGDPTLLMAPQWDPHGFLQLFQTHLSGGGRWKFTTGRYHHYLPALSADGRHLAYAQADFDPEGEGGIREELFLFDFAHIKRAAVSLGERPGGQPGQGPAFVGTGPTLVWIAEGRVHKVTPVSAPPAAGASP